jgi:hypothetical protein
MLSSACTTGRRHSSSVTCAVADVDTAGAGGVPAEPAAFGGDGLGITVVVEAAD